jgi:hypothetical protein
VISEFSKHFSKEAYAILKSTYVFLGHKTF